MPQFRKLTHTEIATLAPTDPAARARIAADYDALLVALAVGDYGLAEPEKGETRLAVRRRLNAAAARRGWYLTFLPIEGEALVFQVGRRPQ